MLVVVKDRSTDCVAQLVAGVRELAAGAELPTTDDIRLLRDQRVRVEQALGATLAEVLGPKHEAFLESQRIITHSDRLFSQLQSWSLNPEQFSLAQARDLRNRIEGHLEFDAKFRDQILESKIFQLLCDRADEGSPSSAGALRISCNTLIPVQGTAIDALRDTLRAVMADLGPGYQIVIRGGSLDEGLGWLTAGPLSDPRERDSAYTRRTGSLVPAFDLTSAGEARDSSQALLACVEDACRYARSGDIYAAAKRQLAEEGVAHIQPQDIKEYPLEFVNNELSRGVLMMFAAPCGSYTASFHRHSPEWNQGSYKHVVTMPEGMRHLKAIIPVPVHKCAYLPGAFAIRTDDAFKSFDHESQSKLFDAAFRRMDPEAYSALLKAGSTSIKRSAA